MLTFWFRIKESRMPEFAVSTTAPCALRPAPFSLVEQPPGGLDTSIGVSGSGARVATVIASRKFLATLPRSNVARPSRDSPPGPETKCQKAAAAFDPHASLRSVRMTVLYPRRKKVYDRRRAVVPTKAGKRVRTQLPRRPDSRVVLVPGRRGASTPVRGGPATAPPGPVRDA